MVPVAIAAALQGRLIARRSASAFLGISVRKLDDLISRGVLRAVRLPFCDKTLLDIHDLQALITASKAPELVEVETGERTA